MPITMLDAVEFSKIPSLQFVIPVVSADPTGLVAADEGRLIYNTTTDQVKYCDGSLTWIALGPAGAGGPPTGAAGGDLVGSYPSPTINVNKVDNTKLADMAASSLKGNNTGSVADPADLTVAQVKTLLAYTKTDVGLSNVDNTADTAKPISTAVSTALSGKADTTTDHIAGAGLTGGGTLAASRTFAVGAGTGITVNADDIAINRTVVDTWYLPFSGGTLTNFLTLHADPSSAMHAATKQYVDLTSQGFSFKTAVRVVASTNITQSGTQTIDGVSVAAGNRVLCAGQSTASQNGIWVVAAGAWTRATDMDANGELVDGTLVPVGEGTANADSQWMCTAIGATPWVAGTSTSTWTRYSGVADVTAGAGLTRTGTALDVGAGSGITVAADSVAVDSTVERNTNKAAANGYASLDGTTKVPIAQVPTGSTASTVALGNHNHDAAYVAIGRSVIAGAGLTGGGTLGADVTLNVVGDANLSVAADLVSVLSAPKWTTPRTITLTGDVTGTSAAWDGSGNISFATVVASAGTAAKHYAGDVPAGTTGIVITHNLNTYDVSVQVYLNSGTRDTVLCDVERPTVNTVNLGFASAVSNAQYRVVVQGR